MQEYEGPEVIPYAEYPLRVVPENVQNVKILGTSQDLYELPMIYLTTLDKGLYCVDRSFFFKQGHFKVIEIEGLQDILVIDIQQATEEVYKQAEQVFRKYRLYNTSSYR